MSAHASSARAPDWAFEPLFDIPPYAPGPESLAHRWLPVQGNQVMISLENAFGALTQADADAVGDSLGQPILLGRSSENGEVLLWWTAPVDQAFNPQGGAGDFMLADLRELMNRLDPMTWNIAGRATQLCDWHRDNQHCGRCGGPMERVPGERSMRCADDGFAAYPRLSPAVIVLIEHPDGRALLARNAAWPVAMYSTLAGFVEPGESLEDTIHREMREEVGVEIGEVRYFGSQPWPFPNSLMLGFVATWAGGDIVPEPAEIADAQWFGRDDLPMIPPRGSIARTLIDDWVARG